MENKYSALEKLFSVLSFVTAAVFIFYFLYSRWPRWWEGVNFERSPMTVLEAVILALVSACALLCGILCLKKSAFREALAYAVLSAGFLVLVLDEIFMFHEQLRDKFLAPAKIKLAVLPWTGYGDFIMPLVLIAGIVLMFAFWKILARRRAALAFFVAAAAVSAAAIGLDSLDMEKYGNQAFRLEQFAEELLETTAMLLFLNSFFYALTGILGRQEDIKDKKR